MEREPLEVTRRLMRAARSLNYNRELQPLVAERIERAEGQLRGHLLARGLTSLQLGPFKVDMDDEGAVEVAQVPVDDNWWQMPLPRGSYDQQPSLESDAAGCSEVRSENGGQEPTVERTTEKSVYGRA